MYASKRILDYKYSRKLQYPNMYTIQSNLCNDFIVPDSLTGQGKIFLFTVHKCNKPAFAMADEQKKHGLNDSHFCT